MTRALSLTAELVTIRVRDEPTRSFVTPTGDLDLVACEVFDRRLRDVQAQAREVVVDLRAVAFIDTAATMRSLCTARERAAASRRRLEVVCSPGQVKEMLSSSEPGRLIVLSEPQGLSMHDL